MKIKINILAIVTTIFLIFLINMAWGDHNEKHNNNVSSSNNQNFHNQNNHQEHAGEHHEHRQVIYYPYPSYPIYPQSINPTNSFYYQNNAGNFVSSETSINFPVNGYWAIVSGQIPPNAVIYYDNHNGVTTYYCRGYFNNVLYYGEFFPNEGCYIKDPVNSATLRLESNFELFLQ